MEYHMPKLTPWHKIVETQLIILIDFINYKWVIAYAFTNNVKTLVDLMFAIESILLNYMDHLQPCTMLYLGVHLNGGL